MPFPVLVNTLFNYLHLGFLVPSEYVYLKDLIVNALKILSIIYHLTATTNHVICMICNMFLLCTDYQIAGTGQVFVEQDPCVRVLHSVHRA